VFGKYIIALVLEQNRNIGFVVKPKIGRVLLNFSPP